MSRLDGALLLLLAAALMQVIDAGLGSLGIDGNYSSGASSQTPFEHHSDSRDVTLQPSHSSFSNTFVIVLVLGFMILSGLAFLLIVRQTSRSDAALSDCDADQDQPPKTSRFCMKRTTTAASEASHDEIDSNGSVVPVLEGNTSKRQIPQGPQQKLKPSWPEVGGAALSSRQSRPAAPMLINAPARGRILDDCQAASDNSLHTDDYSIDMLESPVSTEYSCSSEGDDLFPSTCWDVDSYRSTGCTFLSTTSSNVFDSNRGRSSGVWRPLHGPGDTPSISSGQSPLPSGVLFVRNIDPTAMRRMRLDTRTYGARASNRMRLDIEV